MRSSSHSWKLIGAAVLFSGFVFSAPAKTFAMNDQAETFSFEKCVAEKDEAYCMAIRDAPQFNTQTEQPKKLTVGKWNDGEEARKDVPIICIDDKLCRRSDFLQKGDSARMVERCEHLIKEIDEGNGDRLSNDSLACNSFFAGYMDALAMMSFMERKKGSSPIFCLREPREVWIRRFLHYLKNHPEMNDKFAGYSLYSLFSEQALCDRSKENSGEAK